MRRRGHRNVLVLAAAVVLLPVTAATAAAGTEPIRGEASTEDRRDDDVEAPQVVVTDVRVGSHDGFDRVVFEIGGEGQAGWFTLYDDDPRSDGSGEPVEVAGDAALRVVLTNIAPPHAEEQPEGVTRWEGDVAGPPGGVIAEVVDDLLFEGNHTFFVGLDQERPYRIARLQDPQRVVIDIVTETVTETEVDTEDAEVEDTRDDAADDQRDDTPVGGVDAGLGGGTVQTSLASVVGVLGLLALVAGALLLARRPT
jgi:hypothetical protein